MLPARLSEKDMVGNVKRGLVISDTLSFLLSCALVTFAVGCAPQEGRNARSVSTQQGDFAHHGGTATIRRSFERNVDDQLTSNDESNDQPLGYFGSRTLVVSSLESGNTYTLDVELDGLEVKRVYFPKGGWVDFLGCELDMNFAGECVDESGRTWIFNGSVVP